MLALDEHIFQLRTEIKTLLETLIILPRESTCQVYLDFFVIKGALLLHPSLLYNRALTNKYEPKFCVHAAAHTPRSTAKHVGWGRTFEHASKHCYLVLDANQGIHV